MLKVINKGGVELFNQSGKFARHLRFEKTTFILVAALLICVGIVFIKAVKICERSVDRYNDSLIELHQSIDPAEITGSVGK